MAANPAVAYATGGPLYAPGMQAPPAPQTSRYFAGWTQPQGYYPPPQQQQQGYVQQPQGYYPGGYQRSI
jgi:hypothetical protein